MPIRPTSLHHRIDGFRRTASLIPLVAVMASCSLPEQGPITAGPASFGALSTSDMRDYFYPRIAGYRYTFSTTLRTYTTDIAYTSLSGPADTAYTLGYQGFTIAGDSVYAVIIKYQVPSGYVADSAANLYYTPATSSFTGAFCSSALPGAQLLGDKALMHSPEFSPVALAGRIRQLVDNFGSMTRSWLRDTIYFTGVHDSVALYKRSGNTYTKVRQLFASDFTLNTSWSTVPNSSTATCQVLAQDESLSIRGATYAAPRLQESNSAYATPAFAEISYAYLRGPVRHLTDWLVTTNGSTTTHYQLIREADVIMYDPSEAID